MKNNTRIKYYPGNYLLIKFDPINGKIKTEAHVSATVAADEGKEFVKQSCKGCTYAVAKVIANSLIAQRNKWDYIKEEEEELRYLYEQQEY